MLLNQALACFLSDSNAASPFNCLLLIYPLEMLIPMNVAMVSLVVDLCWVISFTKKFVAIGLDVNMLLFLLDKICKAFHIVGKLELALLIVYLLDL